MTVAYVVYRIIAAVTSGIAKFFDAVIAREATEDDLPWPA
jgi:hypothetical protein